MLSQDDGTTTTSLVMYGKGACHSFRTLPSQFSLRGCEGNKQREAGPSRFCHWLRDVAHIHLRSLKSARISTSVTPT